MRREQCRSQAGCVGEHVGGVDQQRKAVGHKRSDNLREQDRRRDRERDGQPAPVHGVFVCTVVVPRGHQS
ncbi:MAG: hypothetical protein R2703_11040 [Micropruina glycogenica]